MENFNKKNAHIQYTKIGVYISAIKSLGDVDQVNV